MYNNHFLGVFIAAIIFGTGPPGAVYARAAPHNDCLRKNLDGGSLIRSFAVAADQGGPTGSKNPHGNVVDARPLPVPFEQAGKDGQFWGYRTSDGIVSISPRYHIANAFLPEGTATVVDDVGWAVIDLKGHVLLRPFVVDNAPDDFNEGLARFSESGKLGFFSRAGRIVIPARYDGARHFSDGLAPVCIGCRVERNGEHHIWVVDNGVTSIRTEIW